MHLFQERSPNVISILAWKSDPISAAPLFVVSDLNQLWVQMDIFEKDIGLIHVGARNSVEVPAYPNEIYRDSQLYKPSGG